MELILRRFRNTYNSTVGELLINGGFYCFTLENAFHEVKVEGETRISKGRYEIKMRYGSPMAKRYEEKYGTKGMLWLQNVPDFSYVYIHVGNRVEDTNGCILVGATADLRSISSFVRNSSDCYVDLYDKVEKALTKGEKVFITILDD